ncbi:uncharacterized protein Z519_12720 [Cladophialophora bantiana CBS 173.52]|uniref:Methyltransferase domain-containing protein n=1 Tax=Cladophialophora bantiana (strain ATCC 10958 / CBS 173.52 / CDC B-1940 / NIH 8579) TaxID=1442370 RepID=A0A0D2H714_CLAB1|nr:uncharacterized protein Z519_12720 [Cladophialophora bantiana CBS 173.52]KIW86665.1 hypothetical protein Z519_12720 [Cladophialophora bantiana CBS 173.52]
MAETTSQTDTYLLQRGIQGSCRLTAQHYLLTQRAGGLLHPAIANEIRSKKDLAIADAGCGNGIWAIEIAEKHPLAEVIGIDVSDAQFPAPWTCPDNCCFHKLDLMQPVDEAYISCFDLINVRLLAGPLNGSDFTPIIDNLFRMLKPNGWIQWQDISSPGIRAYDSSESSDIMPHWRQPAAISTQFSAFVRSTEWLGQLPTFMKQRGFIDIEIYECLPKTTILRHETDDIGLVLIELSKARPRVEPDTAAKFKDAVAELLQEISEGRLFTVVLQTTIGRKPRGALTRTEAVRNTCSE